MFVILLITVKLTLNGLIHNTDMHMFKALYFGITHL